MNKMSLIFENFSLIFSSIVMEALPFILVGALLSSFVQMFLTEEMVGKVIPKNKFMSSFVAAFLGVFFPICECATVPMTKGLIKKGVPLRVGITYMLSAPIVNPLVILSTYYAFGGQIKFVFMRVFLGVLIAIIVGFLIEILQGKELIFKDYSPILSNYCNCGCNDFDIGKGKLITFISHGSKEIFQIGKFFIIGAMCAAIFQVLVPKNIISNLSTSGPFSIVIMMIFAYLISLCSEADAFIAKTFLGVFSPSAIMAFLVLGPMIDIKNTIMMIGIYKKSFIFKLLFLIFSLTFILCAFIMI